MGSIASYFMSQQDQDAVVGRLLREHKEQSDLVVKLDVEAKRLGEEYTALGQALILQPGGVVFPGEGVPTGFTRQRYEVKPSIFEVERLKALLTDYRSAVAKRDQYFSQLTSLGHSPR